MKLLVISVELQKKKKHYGKKAGKKKDISCCRDNHGIQNKKRNTHRQGKKDILLQFTSSKGTSPFLQFEIFMKFKRLRRKQNKNKALLTFAFKKSLKTTLPSQNQEFRHGYEARS